MTDLLRRAVQLTPPPKNVDEVLFYDGNTQDIMTVIKEADSRAAKLRLTRRFAPLLRGANDRLTCQNIWNFVKQNIPYKADSAGYERVRLPNKCIHDAAKIGNGGDCKTFSVLIADLCREHGIEFQYDYISQKENKKIHHVYGFATLDNGRKVILDAVHTAFDSEPYYKFKLTVPSVGLRQNTEGGVSGFTPFKISSFQNGVIY